MMQAPGRSPAGGAPARGSMMPTQRTHRARPSGRARSRAIVGGRLSLGRGCSSTGGAAAVTRVHMIPLRDAGGKSPGMSPRVVPLPFVYVCHAAVVRRDEVEEPFVVGVAHTEQLHHRSV